MAGSLERARLLYEQGRHDAAIEALRNHLADAPGDVDAVALLALCRCGKKEYSSAEEVARQAIAIDPQSSFAHFALAASVAARGRFKLAVAAIEDALRLAPRSAYYHGMHGIYLLALGRHDEALAAADRGLELDPESSECLNARARALQRLGHHEEARQTLGTALSSDPEDPFTHSNRGWFALEQKEYEAARFHFSEALRRNPSLESARAGLVEALKAKNPLYRPLLVYTLWMSRMTFAKRLAVVGGLYLAVRFAVGALGNSSRGQDLSFAVQIAYALFVLASWLAHPFFNLLLATDEFGRQTLTKAERGTAFAVGACLGMALFGAILGYFLGIPPFVAALVYIVLAIPASSAGNCAPGLARKFMIALTIALLVTGTAGFVLWSDLFGEALSDMGAICVAISIGGALLSTILGNILAHWKPNR